jgi:hypothetical protein
MKEQRKSWCLPLCTFLNPPPLKCWKVSNTQCSYEICNNTVTTKMLFTKLDMLSCLLNLTICAQFTISLKKKNAVFILLGNHKLCVFKTLYRPQVCVWQATGLLVTNTDNQQYKHYNSVL